MFFRFAFSFCIQISMGCKQHRACYNNKANNFKGTTPSQNQCRPALKKEGSLSVCRQCCDKDTHCAINYLRWDPMAGGPAYNSPWKNVMTTNVLAVSEKLSFGSQNHTPSETTHMNNYQQTTHGVQHSPGGGFQVSLEQENAAVNRLTRPEDLGRDVTGGSYGVSNGASNGITGSYVNRES